MPIGIPGYIILRVAGGLGWCWGAGTPPSVRDPPPPGDERTRVAVGKRVPAEAQEKAFTRNTRGGVYGGRGGSQLKMNNLNKTLDSKLARFGAPSKTKSRPPRLAA